MKDVYDELYEEFTRMCPWAVPDVDEWSPTDDMQIIVSLKDGSAIRYDGVLRCYRYVPKKEMLFERCIPENEAEWRKIFASVLYRRMRLMGYTQETLAYDAGLSQGTVNRYLNQLSMPNAWAIVKLAQVLDCSVSDLVDFG